MVTLGEKVEGMRKPGEFVQWWKANRSRYLTRPNVEAWGQNKVNMRRLKTDLYREFTRESVRGENSVSSVESTFVHPIKSPHIRAVLQPTTKFIAARSQALIGVLTGAITAGPIARLVNSFFDSTVTPIAQTVGQQGTVILEPITRKIAASLISSGDLNAAKGARDKMAALTEEMSTFDFKMAPDQAEKKWEEYQRLFFEYFQVMQKALPAHLRDGRSLLREYRSLSPLDWATKLVTFNTNYEVHKGFYEMAKAKVDSAKAEGRQPTADELGELERHKEFMAAALDQIAGTLAAERMVTFLYSEYYKDSQIRSKSAQILRKSMHFELYYKHFHKQAQDILTQMDSAIKIEETLKTEMEKRGTRQPTTKLMILF